MTKCPTCERPASERTYKDFMQVNVCKDPIHDYADDVLELVEQLRTLRRDTLIQAADEIQKMSAEVTPNMGTANGAIVKQGIEAWLRRRADDD